MARTRISVTWESRERINVAREHCALSGPRQTTTQTIAPADDAGPGGLDFARAAAVLTDAAAKAGAAIMAHFGDGSEVTLKDDNSPVTRADRDSEAIILAALARLAPDIRVDPTLAGVRTRRDELLERALAQLQNP